MHLDLPPRITDRIVTGAGDTCDMWNGPPSSTTGYGKVYFNGKVWEVHRLVWIAHNGPIANGLVVDHTCHNRDPLCAGGVTCPHRLCTNVTHLALKTRGQNVLDGNTLSAANALKTHCPQGHSYSAENTKIETDGSRKCLTCRRNYDRRRRPRKT